MLYAFIGLYLLFGWTVALITEIIAGKEYKVKHRLWFMFKAPVTFFIVFPCALIVKRGRVKEIYKNEVLRAANTLN